MLTEKGGPPIPSWFPLKRISAENFVGVLEEGFLFRGELPDQYYWVEGR